MKLISSNGLSSSHLSIGIYRRRTILNCISFAFSFLKIVFQAFVVASLVPLSWMFDDSQRQLSYFGEDREISRIRCFKTMQNYILSYQSSTFFLCAFTNGNFRCGIRLIIFIWVCQKMSNIILWLKLPILEDPLLGCVTWGGYIFQLNDFMMILEEEKNIFQRGCTFTIICDSYRWTKSWCQFRKWAPKRADYH